jgi:lipoyl-dependent peroxiredoxin
MMKTVFEAQAEATGGRDSHVISSDGALDIDLALPKELGGDGAVKPNPAMLFAAGYAACMKSALNNIASHKNIALQDDKVLATVSFLAYEPGSFGLGVKLEVTLPGIEDEVAHELIKAAHEKCPYSKAVKGNIPEEIVLVR